MGVLKATLSGICTVIDPTTHFHGKTTILDASLYTYIAAVPYPVGYRFKTNQPYVRSILTHIHQHLEWVGPDGKVVLVLETTCLPIKGRPLEGTLEDYVQVRYSINREMKKAIDAAMVACGETRVTVVGTMFESEDFQVWWDGGRGTVVTYDSDAGIMNGGGSFVYATGRMVDGVRKRGCSTTVDIPLAFEPVRSSSPILRTMLTQY
jgi:hypothetical protein